MGHSDNPPNLHEHKDFVTSCYGLWILHSLFNHQEFEIVPI